MKDGFNPLFLGILKLILEMKLLTVVRVKISLFQVENRSLSKNGSLRNIF